MKFLLANVADFDVENQSISMDELPEIDQYALGQLRELFINCRDAYNQYEFQRISQMLLNYCSEDLGGFYLDVLKDRLYTTAKNSKSRRAAQTVLWQIVNTLAGLVAPIITFTAEEVWQTLYPETDDYVLLNCWLDSSSVDSVVPELLPNYDYLKCKWEIIRRVRSETMREIEVLRSAGKVGSSLQVELDIYASLETYDLLESLSDDLRFVMITSRATLHKDSEIDTAMPQYKIVVSSSTYKKCDRCWHYRADVGSHAEHPSICGRCVSNLFGAGEVRKYA